MICPATPVHATPLPEAPAALASVPWSYASPGLAGFLFAAQRDATALELPVGGVWPDGRHAKILWVPRKRGAGRTLTITSGAYRQVVPMSGAGDFPSIVSLPRAGCWRLELRSGRLRGVVVVRAVDP